MKGADLPWPRGQNTALVAQHRVHDQRVYRRQDSAPAERIRRGSEVRDTIAVEMT